MRKLLILIWIFSGSFCCSQNNDFSSIAKTIKKIPHTQEKSTTNIANYIKSKFRSREDQLKATFYWTATNIDYVVEEVRRGVNYNSVEELINVTLKKRRGVCQAYSEIFNEIARKLDFESHVVSGYVRQNGQISTSYGHAWNAAKLNNKWYLFDPTWAAGHFLISSSSSSRNRSEYIKEFTPEYFKVSPTEFIKSHMPFDPIWQLTNAVIKYSAFDQNRFKKGSGFRFNYQKIIVNLESYSDIENIKNEIDRIEFLGNGNRLVRNNLKNLKRNLEIATTNKDGEIYNQALVFHSNSINIFNEYVELFNQNNSGNRTKISQLKNLLNLSFKASTKAQTIYESITTSNSTLQLNIKIKKGDLVELFEKIEEEKRYQKRN